LVHTFEASSTYEAMQIYNKYLGRAPWTTEYPMQDMAEFSDEEAEAQRASLKKPS
jgi:hypothetical protein